MYYTFGIHLVFLVDFDFFIFLLLLSSKLLQLYPLGTANGSDCIAPCCCCCCCLLDELDDLPLLLDNHEEEDDDSEVDE